MPKITSTEVFAIRYIPDDTFMPLMVGGKGYTQVNSSQWNKFWFGIPRLFTNKRGASKALSTYVKGKREADYTLTDEGRKEEDYEVVRLQLVRG